MRSHRWRSVQSGLPESAHGCPELVKHALLVEADGMSRNISPRGKWAEPVRAASGARPPVLRGVTVDVGLVTLCRVASAAARGPQSRLGLRPAVPSSVAPSCSSPAPPHGPQSPIGACAAGDTEQSVRSETNHA